jgi:hypothetical protein
MSNDLQKIQQSMAAQHPLHGMMAEVFERRGGVDWLDRLAEEHPRWFITMMVKMVPGVAPTAAMSGDLNITINNTLVRTELDG